MKRQWLANAAVGAPAMPGAPSLGYPQDGATPTVPGAQWYHQVTEEILAVIAAGGLTPDAGTLTQLRDAIAVLAGLTAASDAEAQALSINTKAITPAKLASAFQGSNQSLGAQASSGYQRLPGGLIVQWGYYSETSLPLPAGGQVSRYLTMPLTFPNNSIVVVAGSTLNYVTAGAVFRPGFSNSQLDAHFSSSSTGALNIDLQWLAVGK